MPRPSLALLILFVTLGCQAIFGDFKIDSSELTVSCRLGSYQCADGALQSCDRGAAWSTVLKCASANQCNIEALGCGPCDPGTYQCNQARLEKCDPGSGWGLQETCAGASQCVIAADGRGSCVPAECPDPGVHRCGGEDGNRLQRCSSDLMWQEVEACASAALCDATLADQQVKNGGFATCKPPVCSAGQFSCATGAAVPCNEARTAFEGSCTAQSCGVCSGCTPGEVRCSGADLMRCTDGAWSVSATCDSLFSCRATGTSGECLASDHCTPGQLSCVVTDLQRCRSDGTAVEAAGRCANQRLCNVAAARCDAPRCRKDDRRCVGKQLQTCLADLSGWKNEGEACKGVCDPKLGCADEPCTSGYRCNDVQLEQCKAGAWTALERCATPVLCENGLIEARTGQAPVCADQACAPGQRRCVLLAGERAPRAIQICRDGLDDYKDFYTCAGTEVCDMDTQTCAALVKAE